MIMQSLDLKKTYLVNEDGKEELVEISEIRSRWDFLKQALGYFFFNAKPDLVWKKDVDLAFFRERDLEKSIREANKIVNVLESNLDTSDYRNEITIRDAKNLVRSLETLQKKVK